MSAPASAPEIPDWPLEPTLEWIAREGRLLPTLPAFIEALFERLARAGAPTWRAYLGLQTIHPQLRSMGVVWRRGGGVSEIGRRHGIERTAAYLGSPIEYVIENRRLFRRRLVDLRAEDHQVLHEVGADGGTDYLAIPIAAAHGRWPAFTVATDRAGGFLDSDIAKIQRVADHMGAVLEMHLGYRVATTLLETYLGRETGDRIMQGLIRRGDGQEISAVLWFSDLRDFTGLSEKLPPERMLAMLNAYFEAVGGAMADRGGSILKFIGDGVMGIFPYADAMFASDAAGGALDAALDVRSRIDALNVARAAAGEPPIRFGVGLHVGKVTFGNIGTEDRLDFTAIGPAVNLCARLESLTKELGAPIAASGEFNAICPRRMRSLGRRTLRGVPDPVEVFTPA